MSRPLTPSGLGRGLAVVVLLGLAPACTPALDRPAWLVVTCGDDADCGGSVCRFGQCTTERVGGSGEPCTQEGRCDAGLSCVEKSCRSLGGALGLSWAVQLGDAADQRLEAMAADAQGNVYLAGGYAGSLAAVGAPARNDTDLFLVKLDAAGKPGWMRSYASTVGRGPWPNALAVAPDASSVTVTGGYAGNVDFGGGVRVLSAGADPAAEGSRVLVARFDAAGKLLWARGFDGGGSAQGMGVATDAAGNSWVVGFFAKRLVADQVTLTTPSDSGAFVLALGPDGRALWGRSFGDGKGAYAMGVALDGDGNGFVVGPFLGTVDFGDGPRTNSSFDEFVVKLAPDGATRWSRQVRRAGGYSSFAPWHVATAADGSVYVASDFSGSVDVGDGGAVPKSDDLEGFVYGYDRDGKLLWSRVLGGPGTQLCSGVAVDAGGVHVVGGYSGSVDLGTGPLASAGGGDVFFGTYSPAGKPLDARRFGDPASQFADGVAVDGRGAVFVGGHFEGTLNFGAGTLTSAGKSDVFVARFAPGP